MPRLLILACSATKVAGPGLMPARERYNGPLWQTLRAHDEDDGTVETFFLSARYGFRPALTSIEDYNSKLTKKLADEMIADGIGGCLWPGRKTKRTPTIRRPSYHSELNTMMPYRGSSWEKQPFDEVCLVGGKEYLRVMRVFVEQFIDAGLIAADACIEEINGSIGIMRRELKQWLTHIPPPSAKNTDTPAIPIETGRGNLDVPSAVEKENSISISLVSEPSSATATSSIKLCGTVTDMDEIPSFLRISAADRKAAWKGRKLTEIKTATRKRRVPWNLPKTICPTGWAILKAQEKAAQERKAARLVALRNKAW